MAKIGIFGGTFDPVHFGHLHLANGMLEKHALDEIWFCPVKISPHKLDQTPTSTVHRLAMLKIALADHPQLKITEVELNRDGPSFTIDTITDLKSAHSEHSFYLIMSDEVLPSFAKWHQPEEIVNRIPFLVASRNPEQSDPPKIPDFPTLEEAVRKGWTQIPVLQISATDIRDRIKKNLECNHLVPQKVLDYIYSNHLYS